MNVAYPHERRLIADGRCLYDPTGHFRDCTEGCNGIEVGGGDSTNRKRIALLSKPNPDIAKGDFLVRSDSSEFRILDVLHVKGSPVMRLYLRGQGVL